MLPFSYRVLMRGVSAVAGASSVALQHRALAGTTRSFSSSSLVWLAPSAPTTQTPPAMGGDTDAEETHPDFQPRMVSSDLAQDEIAMIKKDIDDTIRDEDIVVFIKGVPEAPMCAFSKRMIDVMEALGVEYTSFDVLAHPVVRSYVKEVSEWPTIPQLFVKGEFAGGVDIILKMAEGGDLQMLLDQKGIKHRDTKP
ncbi:FUT1 / fucosyltransferase [Leishmania donovani]|uniref:Glutaredoxin-like protein n=2 Tax=Leishmania donovani TaxID=5661 RepID=A0A3S5H4T1_LEIDO|nr:glutaredoxin-like protein [Leishmania donovani]AYU75522.1 monothiol glutaredoxin, putative [Leishmania donovani]CAJ1985596.1 FUT1 / fucosyltransferase [Leishmania donovani]CBZ31098.1 glutaredoxin-like protein [Leishmania donovani]VDZ41501.1 monothiol_glutaredoxin_putative/GeneDB:LmjF.01.0110 [Leishmania donovani]